MKKLIALTLRLSKAVLCRRQAKSMTFLIPAYTGLGNFILKTKFLSQLRESFPQAKISILCGDKYGVSDFIQGSPLVDEVLKLSENSSFFEKFRFYLKLRGRFSAMFLFLDTHHAAHLFWGSILAGIPKRIGHLYPKELNHDDQLARAVIDESVFVRLKTHEVDLNLDLLRPLLGEFDFSAASDDISYLLKKEFSQSIAKKMVKKNSWIAVQTSAANAGRTPKVWLPSYFRILIQQLLQNGHSIALVGDSAERNSIETLISGLEGRIKNFAGQTTLSDLAHILSRSRLVICHDSGVMHLANALHIPLVAIFGPGDHFKNRPLSATAHTLRDDLPCAPCIGLNGYWSESEAVERCHFDRKCMRQMTPDRVLRAVEAILQTDVLTEPHPSNSLQENG